MLNLALKYRPKSLVDLVGQDHNVRILNNIITQHMAGEELPAVFLFAGSRGTGKTTTARILAKLLNCDHLLATNGALIQACGSCIVCKNIDKFMSVDIIEIDAASHGNVDSVRGLKEQTMYQSHAKMRMITIDECHSMSKEAFDALLKLFEEPPPATVFCLCTTEPDKLPDTILSRAMVFEFRRIKPERVESRLVQIAGLEQIDVAVEVLHELARKVDGSLRDALISLTQLSLYAGKQSITMQMFEEMFGIRGGQYFPAIIQAIAKREVNNGLILVADFYSKAGELVLVDGLIDEFKSMLVGSVTGKRSVFPENAIIEALRILWDVRVRVKYTGVNARTMLDIMFVMLSRVLTPQAAMTGTQITQPKPASMAQLAGIFGNGSPS